jgi:dipeptidyl aminopeptidase/acylaminoacyl peptidase
MRVEIKAQEAGREWAARWPRKLSTRTRLIREVPMLNRLMQTPRSLLVVCIAVLAFGGFAPVQGQDPGLQDVPPIKASFTKVFSTDSVGLGMSALSPDGRWIVFGGWSRGGTGNLRIVSTAGGDPVSLGLDGDGSVWFPSGDRIAIRCEGHIASLGIDPATGRPVGNPQRVTIEPSSAYFDISHDGKWIAYTPMDGNGNRVIRVVPSNGGIARTVAEAETTRPAWSPDGRSIYYAIERPNSPGEMVLMRVAVEGGARAENAEPEEVFSHMGHIGTLTYPGSAFVSLPMGEGRVEITTLEGTILGMVELESGMRIRNASADGRIVLVERRGNAAPIRVAPVAGGPIQTLLEPQPSYALEPGARALGWTPDGEQVLVETALDGTERFFLVSVSRGVMTEISLPEERTRFGVGAMDFPMAHRPDPVLSGDGRHLLYALAVVGSAPDTATLKILDVESGRARILTTSSPVPGWQGPGRVLGPGGMINRDEDEFFYWEKAGDKLGLKAVGPAGESRVLRTFDDPERSLAVAVRENRIVYVSNGEGEATIFLAEPGQAESRALLTVEGTLDILAWSPDGRWLAATHWPAGGDQATLALIRLPGDGTVQGEPRYLGPKSWSWWGHQWLPDSSGFLTAGTQGDIWFIPVDPLAEPAPITGEEVGATEDFVLSPDGTYVAYAPRVVGGDSLWLIDLGDVLNRSSR